MNRCARARAAAISSMKAIRVDCRLGWAHPDDSARNLLLASGGARLRLAFRVEISARTGLALYKS